MGELWCYILCRNIDCFALTPEFLEKFAKALQTKISEMKVELSNKFSIHDHFIIG